MFSLELTAYLMGDEANKKEISYTHKPEESRVQYLLAYILNKFKVTYQAQNRFKLRHRPENGHPHILNNSKAFHVQGVMNGDVVEVIYCGELGTSESPADEKTSIWDMFKTLSPSDFRKSPRDIGRGKDGVVYKATAKNKSLGVTIVALKELTSCRSDDSISMKYLQNELRIMAACDHPAILPLVGVIPPSKENPMTIVTPYLSGSLENWISRSRDSCWGTWDLKPIDRYIILYGIASGMQYLHRHQVQHRDLKPANVLLESNAQPVICDFGRAKITDAESSTEQSIAVGSWHYMAPEAFRDRYGMKTDVYSFGVLMWAVWMRREPFSERKGGVIQHIVYVRDQAGRPQPLPTGEDDMTKRIVGLMTRCWDGNSADRPSFDEIVEELEDSSVIPNATDRKKFEEYVQKLKQANDTIELQYIEVSGSSRTVSELESLANEGNSGALVELGRRYETGDMVEPNVELAVQYYREAASRGYSDGYEYLSRCYLYGIGVSKDPVSGEALHQKALATRQKDDDE